MWVGTNFNGLLVYEPRTNTYHTFKFADAEGHTLPVPAMIMDSTHTIWIARGKGLLRTFHGVSAPVIQAS
ncbi:MAG: hypothetical protein JWP27_1446 [Flaviaesturariibacter sp.]|nr:hypothetical protein [Flaviaesturariibacter sp.]